VLEWQKIVNRMKRISSIVKLDRFTMDDIDENYISWLNDKELMKFSNQRFKAHTVESCREYLYYMEEANNLFYAIRIGSEKKKIGTITAYINHRHKTADIGILIGRKDIAGKGYGHQAWVKLIEILVVDKGIRKITCGTLRCNEKMMRIIKKTKMKEEGVRIKQEVVDGKEIDMMLYGLLAADYWEEVCK